MVFALLVAQIHCQHIKIGSGTDSTIRQIRYWCSHSISFLPREPGDFKYISQAKKVGVWRVCTIWFVEIHLQIIPAISISIWSLSLSLSQASLHSVADDKKTYFKRLSPEFSDLKSTINCNKLWFMDFYWYISTDLFNGIHCNWWTLECSTRYSDTYNSSMNITRFVLRSLCVYCEIYWVFIWI